MPAIRGCERTTRACEYMFKFAIYGVVLKSWLYVLVFSFRSQRKTCIQGGAVAKHEPGQSAMLAVRVAPGNPDRAHSSLHSDFRSTFNIVTRMGVRARCAMAVQGA